MLVLQHTVLTQHVYLVVFPRRTHRPRRGRPPRQANFPNTWFPNRCRQQVAPRPNHDRLPSSTARGMAINVWGCARVWIPYAYPHGVQPAGSAQTQQLAASPSLRSQRHIHAQGSRRSAGRVRRTLGRIERVSHLNCQRQIVGRIKHKRPVHLIVNRSRLLNHDAMTSLEMQEGLIA